MIKLKSSILHLFFFLSLVFTFISQVSAQKVAIVGYNGTSPDGISFVALEMIEGGTVIYFTEKEFNNSTGKFNAEEGVWSWTAPAGGLAKGHVVVMKETGVSTNIMAVSCTSGPCGSATTHATPISLASSSAETVHAYADSDNNPQNGVSEIYSVFRSTGALPAGENPTSIFPNALIVSGFPSSTHEQYTVGLRSNPTSLSNLQNAANYTKASGYNALSTTAFNIQLGGADRR